MIDILRAGTCILGGRKRPPHRGLTAKQVFGVAVLQQLQMRQSVHFSELDLSQRFRFGSRNQNGLMHRLTLCNQAVPDPARGGGVGGGLPPDPARPGVVGWGGVVGAGDYHLWFPVCGGGEVGCRLSERTKELLVDIEITIDHSFHQNRCCNVR